VCDDVCDDVYGDVYSSRSKTPLSYKCSTPAGQCRGTSDDLLSGIISATSTRVTINPWCCLFFFGVQG
jgi:hypothetical protein